MTSLRSPVWALGLCLVAASAGCGNDCEEGYGKANDGNCYPIEDGDDDDDDDDRGDDDDDDGPGDDDDDCRGYGCDDTGYYTYDYYDYYGYSYGDDDDDDDDTVYTVPYVHDAYIYCVVEENGEPVTLEVSASVDNGSKSVIDMADTSRNTPYYEAHTLLPASARFGTTEFAASITSGDGATLQYVDGVSTTFQCESGVHIAEDTFGAVMTYLVRTYEANGALWECFAAGNDPAGMVDGDYNTFGNEIGAIPSDCLVVGRAN